MQELKLHSFGQNDHIESLKKKYDSLRQKIKGNLSLTENEKSMELKKLADYFKKEKKESGNNLY